MTQRVNRDVDRKTKPDKRKWSTDAQKAQEFTTELLDLMVKFRLEMQAASDGTVAVYDAYGDRVVNFLRVIGTGAVSTPDGYSGLKFHGRFKQ